MFILGHRYAVPEPNGFSLLEVLIAMVVLSIGLLGLAGLQLSALRGNNQSYERSQAQLLAYEIADAMRTNRVEAAAGTFNMSQASPPAVPPGDCLTASCTRGQAALLAARDWFGRVQVMLPQATASVACSATPCASGVMHTVQVMWDEQRRGLDRDTAAARTCPPGAAFDPDVHLGCVQLSFVP